MGQFDPLKPFTGTPAPVKGHSPDVQQAVSIAGMISNAVPLRVIAVLRNRELTEQEAIRCAVQSTMNRAHAQNASLGNILIRRELSKITGLNADTLHVVRNEYGKPFLQDRPDVQFNLSHSDTIILAAFHTKPVGIDVETIKPFNTRMTSKVFSAAEQEHYDLLSGNAQTDYFYTIWTQKEAYLKKLGIGLSRPMRSFTVCTLNGVYFEKIVLHEQTIGHVCTAEKAAPVLTVQTLDAFLGDLA